MEFVKPKIKFVCLKCQKETPHTHTKTKYLTRLCIKTEEIQCDVCGEKSLTKVL